MTSEDTRGRKIGLVSDEDIMEFTPASIHYVKDRSRMFKDAEFPVLRIKEETIEDAIFFKSRVPRGMSKRGILAKMIAHIKNRFHFIPCFLE
jgi:hypothetical protein